MLSNRARRVGVLAAPALLGAFVLASCGDADGAATVSTIELSEGSTAFVVRPPATTEPEVQVDGASVTTEQEYVIQAGDTPIGIANQFGVSLDDLVAYNEWGSAANFPFPGTTIRIPPGGTAPAGGSSGDAGGEEAAPAATAAPDPSEPAATIPDAGDNCAAGTYTIEEGDTTRLGVAQKFDVTVEELDAANAGTPGYSAFYPGLEIVIPAKDDC